jgi:hypothetical protein
MKTAHTSVIVLLVLSLAVLACGSSAPTEAAHQTQPNTGVEPNATTAMATRTPFQKFPTSSPAPTDAFLQLEILQTQTWADYQGNARVNVLFRNPYEFPVSIGNNPRATLMNSAGDFLRDGLLYFLDGISGGSGFLLPGETIAANSCFTCEEALLTEPWDSVKFVTRIENATGKWNYSTDVEASGVRAAFYDDQPTFDVSGAVTNNSDSALERISVRVIVFDQEGNLVGAAEVSAWDVAAGTTVAISGYGIAQPPDGPVTYEVSALGVEY